MQRTDLFKALRHEIILEDGYNGRDEYTDIPELADSIVENGIIQAVRAYQKKGDINRLTLISGHRRMAAVDLAIADGRLDPNEFKIPVIKVLNMSDIDKTLDLITSNSGVPLTALEKSNVYKRAEAYGCTPEEIAKKVGKSITTIKNLLLLNSASASTKKMIVDGMVSTTTVIGLLKKKEPKDVDAELKTAIAEKRAAITAASNLQPILAPVNVRNERDMEDGEIPKQQDNVKTTGVSGMELPEDSSAPIKITKKNLDKTEKILTYSKAFILDLLLTKGVSDDEKAYVVILENLK